MKKMIFCVCMTSTLNAMVAEPGEHGQPLLLPLFEKIMKTFGVCGSGVENGEAYRLDIECPSEVQKEISNQSASSIIAPPSTFAMKKNMSSQDSLQKALDEGSGEVPFYVQKTQHEIVIFFCKEDITQ